MIEKQLRAQHRRMDDKWSQAWTNMVSAVVRHDRRRAFYWGKVADHWWKKSIRMKVKSASNSLNYERDKSRIDQ